MRLAIYLSCFFIFFTIFYSSKVVIRNIFKDINFHKQEDLEKSIEHYINTLASVFINNPQFAKLFAKELACEGEHLEEETLKITSKTIKKSSFSKAL